MSRALPRLALAAALLGAVLWLTDGRAALARLSAVDPVWMAACVILLSAQTLLMALRWQRVAGALGIAMGYRHAVGEYYLAQIVNTTLPGGVLGDVGRAARSRHDAGLGTAAMAVAIERLAGQIALGAIAVTGFAMALIVPGGIAWPDWTLWPLVGAMLLALALTLALRRRGARFAAAVHGALLRPESARVQVPLGLAIGALNLAAFAAAARATGTSLGPEATVTLVPLILTAMLIPLSVAGWGWREGAAAALFPLIGADPAAGVAAGIAFGAAILVASLPGALWPLIGAEAPMRPHREAHLASGPRRPRP